MYGNILHLLMMGSIGKFYKNGIQLVSQNMNTSSAWGGFRAITIHGYLDDLRIYNHALSASEVAVLAQGNNPRTAAGVIRSPIRSMLTET